MPTGNLLRQETVTRKTRPQLSELNSNDLRPMFTTPVARSQIVLDSSEATICFTMLPWTSETMARPPVEAVVTGDD